MAPGDTPATLPSHAEKGTDTDNPYRRAAQDYLERGWSAVPEDPSTKHPPIPWKPYQTTHPTIEELDAKLREIGRSWEATGIVTGKISDVIVIEGDGDEAVLWIYEQGIVSEDTPRFKTKRGMQFLFKHPGFAVKNSASELYPGVDVRGDGGVTVAPPSPKREWVVEPGEEMPELPVSFVEHNMETLRRHTEESTKQRKPRLDTAAVLSGVPEGQRDTKLFALASKFRQADVPYDAAEAFILEAAVNCTPPFDQGTALEKVKNAYGRYTSGGFNLTDLGNAERFIAQHGHNVRYCFPWGCWMVYTGKRWEADRAGQVAAWARETVRSIYAEAANEEDPGRHRAIADHAKRSEANGRIRAMLEQAKSFVPVLPEDLDADIWLFNCENGTIDLRTGELREHRREDLITKLAGTAFEPDAEAPTWHSFLERVLPSEALRRFVQRVIGYSLTGDVSEQQLFFPYGSGANGKSTLINTLLDVMGDYGQQAAPELLTVKSTSHPTELADLKGARFVASIEVEEGKRFAESLVKQMTGGDRIKARFMRQDFFEFDPTHKVFLVANHKPVIRGTDWAIWRRIKLIPFDVTIPKEEQDPKLPEKLKAELPGILAWAVRGCLEWQREGLGEPDEVLIATEEYRSEMDVLGDFLEERCVVKPDGQVTFKELYAAYLRWCEESGERAETKRTFGTRLTERGFEAGRGAKNVPIRSGITLREADFRPNIRSVA